MSLIKQYKALRQFDDEYYTYLKGLVTQCIVPKLRGSRNLVKFLKKTDTESVGLPRDAIDWIKQHASEEDKANPLFDTITSELGLEALAIEVQKRFPGFDFKSLRRIHESESKTITNLDSVIPFRSGIFFGVAVFIATTIPSSLIKIFPWLEYIQMVGYLLFVIFGFLLFLWFIPIVLMIREKKGKSQRIALLLEYITIFIEHEKCVNR